MTIKFNDKLTTINDSSDKVYITKRNSFSKGGWFKVFIDSDGNKFVKFWKEQVAVINRNGGSYVMVHAYDIVK